MSAPLDLLRALAHAPGAARAQRAEAVRAALPAIAAGCVVTRDYLRDALGLGVTPGEAQEVAALVGRGSPALACAYQVARMRASVAGWSEHARLLRAVWAESDEIDSALWTVAGRSVGIGYPEPPRAADQSARWLYRVGRADKAALSARWRDLRDPAFSVARPPALRIGPTLRAALEGAQAAPVLRAAGMASVADPAQMLAHVRAAVAAVRPSEQLGGGWISARLDLEQGDPAALRLARLLRREEEV